MARTRQLLTVRRNEQIAPEVFDLWLEYPASGTAVPEEIRPGQFVGLYCRDGSRLLPRPISICDWRLAGQETFVPQAEEPGSTDHAGAETTQAALRLVYRRVGKGTGEISHYRPGEEVEVLGILGNGYDPAVFKGRRVLLVGGGIGAPPLLGLARTLAGGGRAPREDGSGKTEQRLPAGAGSRLTTVLGYRTDQLFLKEDFEPYGRVIVATDDGTAGVHGTVVDAIRKELDKAHETNGNPGTPPSEEQSGMQQETGKTGFPWDAICACGPLPMLRGIKALAGEYHVPCYVSMEEHMACGVGACLGCVVQTTRPDAHSHVNNARICTEGPVFNAEDVVI